MPYRRTAPLAALLLALALACGGADAPPAPDAAVRRVAVVVDSGAARVVVGDSLRLRALPLDAGSTIVPGVVVRWESTSPDVVAVDDRGLARALRPGSATITARAGSAA